MKASKLASHVFGLLFALVLSKSAMADYWPDIYAVAEIEMKNGEVLECIIQLAPSGERVYLPNGFAYDQPGGRIPTLQFFSLYYSNDFENTHPHLYYLVNDSPFDYPYHPPIIDSSGTDLLVTIEFMQKSKYRLSDTMQIFMEIDFWQRPDTSKAVLINVNDIFRFRLVNSPSAKWTELIAKRRQEYQAASEANPSDYGEDFFEPFWYHELSQEQRIEFNQHFKN
jgi:hypothetical protein